MKRFFSYLLCMCLLVVAGCTEIIYLPAEEYDEKYGQEQIDKEGKEEEDKEEEDKEEVADKEEDKDEESTEDGDTEDVEDGDSGNAGDETDENVDDEGNGSEVESSDKPVEFQGSGTIDDPYIISSLAHLEKLRSDVTSGMMYRKEYFLQTEDIVLNQNLRDAEGELLDGNFKRWSGIGRSEYEFCGHYDGGNHIISGLYGDSLFDYIKDGSISNLVIKDSYVQAGATSRGILCSFLKNAKISNCHVKSSTALCDGGIVGIITDAVVENSSFEGVMKGSCGGAVADSGSGTIRGCANLGVFDGYEDGYPRYIGGIVRYGGNGDLSIVNCLNAGEMNDSSRSIGGIVGMLFKIYSDDCRIINNLNYAKVSYRAGGIVGKVEGASKQRLTIKHNYYIETFSHKWFYQYTDASCTSEDNVCMSAKEMKSEEFVAKLNKTATSMGWCKWKIGRNGLPVLEWMD